MTQREKRYPDSAEKTVQDKEMRLLGYERRGHCATIAIQAAICQRSLPCPSRHQSSIPTTY